MNGLNLIRLAAGLAAVAGARLLWIAITGLRQAGRLIDQTIAEQNAPTRYAAGIAHVPDQQEGGQR